MLWDTVSDRRGCCEAVSSGNVPFDNSEKACTANWTVCVSGRLLEMCGYFLELWCARSFELELNGYVTWRNYSAS